jgi:hypothetical protein
LKIARTAQAEYFQAMYTHLCQNFSPEDVKPIKEVIKYLGAHFQTNEYFYDLEHRLLAAQAQFSVHGKCSISLLDLAKVLKLKIEAFNSISPSISSIPYSPSLPSLSLDCRSRLEPSLATLALSSKF